MKFLLSIMALGLIVSTQGQSLSVGKSSDGHVVIYHGKLPVERGTEIVRIDKQGKEKAFPLEQASGRKMFEKNIGATPELFSYLLEFNATAADTIWSSLQKASSTGDLPMYTIPNVAFACGLALSDPEATAAGEYSYRLRVNGQWQSDPVAPAKDGVWSENRARSLGQKDMNDESIRMGWLIPENAQADLLGVVVYRSKLFEDVFEPIRTLRGFQNQGDSLVATVRDTTTELQGVWQYAIRMIDRYGNASALSELIVANNYPNESSPFFSQFKATGKSDQPVVELSWNLENSFRARTIRLFRSKEYTANYQQIAVFPSTQTSYTDYVDEFMESWFYYLEVEDIAGVEGIRSATHPAVCEFRPEALPVNELSCEPVQGGNVRVKWVGNPPMDRGYYIARTEGYDEEQLEIVSSFIPALRTQSEYEWIDKDTLLRGDRYYTYGIISESHGYSKSEITATASTRPERTVFVPTPSRCNLRQEDDGSGYTLTWEHVATKDHLNHFGYQIYSRKRESTDAYREMELKPILMDTNWHTFATVDPGLEFAVRSIDIFGNKSSFSPPAKLNDPFLNDFGPRFLRAERKENNKAEIRWNTPVNKPIKGYELFVTDGETDPVVAGKFEAATVKCEVNLPPEGTTHYYFIVAIDQSDLPSSPSEWVTLMR